MSDEEESGASPEADLTEPCTGEAAEPAAGHFAAGARLQSVRLARGLSQRELARRAGVTNGSLSLIEQGKVSPSLGSLEKILSAIPMSLPEFFAESSPIPVVHPASEWVLVSQGLARKRVMPLQHVTDRACYLVECELPPGSQETTSAILGRNGLAAGVVIDGALEMRLDDVCHRLETGDGFQFAGPRDQHLVNTHERACRLVLFIQAAQ